MAVPVEKFQAQMNYLHKKGYTSFTLEDYVAGMKQNNLPEKTVVITFDDGYRDNYLFAFPILKQYGFRGTFFLTVAYIGTNEVLPMCREKSGPVEVEDLPLTWEQIAEMKEYGMEFGSHTCYHWHLDELPEEEMVKELTESKRCLEEKLQSKVTSFCYPSGRFDKRVKEAVCRAGYLAAVVTPRHEQPDEDLYSLKRIGIYFCDAGWRFRLKTSSYFTVFRDCGLVCRLKGYMTGLRGRIKSLVWKV